MKQLKILHEDIIYKVRQVWICNKYGCQGVELNINSMYVANKKTYCKDEKKLKSEVILEIWIDGDDRRKKEHLFKPKKELKK